MEPSTWKRLEEIFFEALELAADERSAFVERACGGDVDLRAEVEAVLAAHLLMDADDASDEVPPGHRAGTRIGAYRLEELIGRGGMGDVYRARRADEQYEHEVAIKIVRSALPPHEMVRRFQLERQILARLEHPNVATLLDGGITEEGQPYLVMQHVRGSAVTDYADRNRLDVRARLRLFVTVCRTVQFAHANLVVHRDLKPSNILVAEDGQVRLLDFGIAKLLDPEGTSGADATRSLLVMTPEHAAPEQFLGLPVTTATDVYQLGVLLYQLLTGRRPFEATRSAELHRVVSEHEPERPSTAIGRAARDPEAPVDTVAEADAARARATTPDALRRQLRGDLDRIVLMALRKEPERRYGSAAELADDVERHLEGFPVRARPESLGYVAGRFVRRHRVGVAAAAALVASLVALAVVSMRFAATSARQAEAIAAERDVAVELASFLETLFEASDPFEDDAERRDTLRVRDLLDDGARRVRADLDDQPLVQARLLGSLGRAYRNLGRLDEALPLLEEAVAIHERESAPDAPELADARTNLAQLLVAQGAFERAEPLLDESIATLERDSVPHARGLADALGVLGSLLQERGRYDEAEQAYRRAVAVSEAAGDVRDVDRARQLSNLATALSNQGRYADAEALLRRAVDHARAGWGPEHPATASMLNNLGSVLREQEKLDEAEGYLREALEVREARLGSLHPATAVSVNNLADLLLARGDARGAEPLFRRSLDMRRALYGEEHPAVGVAWTNLAAVLQRLERRDEAVDAYDVARRIFVATVGPAHPVLGGIEGNLGYLYHDSGDHERAAAHLRTALEIRRAALDERHPLVLGNLSDLGRCLTDLGRHAEAEAVLLEAYRGLEPGKESDARRWDAVLVRLARLYRAMGRDAEAERYEAMREAG